MSTPTAWRGRGEHRQWHRIGTRWHDNDVFGHVNNTVYYAWFDTTVCGWLIAAGLLDHTRGERIGLVVETGCTYRSAVAFPDDVDIGLRVARIGSSSVTYHLGVFVAKADQPAAQGHFTHVYVDATTRRPLPLDDRWRAVLAAIA